MFLFFSKSSRLYFAIREGNHIEVERLLASGCNPNCKFIINVSPYTELKSIDMIDYIIITIGNAFKYIFNNYEDSEFYNQPILLAANCGNNDAVQRLIYYNADINLTTAKGETALHAAVENGDKAMIEILFNAGIDLNAKDNFGETALHKACRMNRTEVTIKLLSMDVDVNSQNNDGDTPAHLLAKSSIREYKNTVAIFFFYRNIDSKIKNRYGQEVVELDTILFGEKKCRTYIRSAINKTEISIIINILDCYPKLIDYVVGSILEKKNNLRLAKAIIGNHQLRPFYEFCEYVQPKSLLGIAIENRNVDAVKWLINNGLDVNARNNKGVVPLSLALQSRSDSIVSILLQTGALVGLLNDVEKKHHLISSEEKIIKYFHDAVKSEDIEKLDNLISNYGVPKKHLHRIAQVSPYLTACVINKYDLLTTSIIDSLFGSHKIEDRKKSFAKSLGRNVYDNYINLHGGVTRGIDDEKSPDASDRLQIAV